MQTQTQQPVYRFLATNLVREDAQTLRTVEAPIAWEDSIVYSAQGSAHARVYQVAEGYIIALGHQAGEGRVCWTAELPIFATLLQAIASAKRFLAPYLLTIRTKIAATK